MTEVFQEPQQQLVQTLFNGFYKLSEISTKIKELVEPL